MYGRPLPVRMGGALPGTDYGHLQTRRAVSVPPMEGAHSLPRYNAPAHHSLSSQIQRLGGVLPSPRQEGDTRSSAPHQLGRPLPIILLTHRATENEDIHHTPVKLVYGADLQLSGQFTTQQTGGHSLAFLLAVQQTVASLQPVSPCPTPSRLIHFLAYLPATEAVFLGPPPYMGPYVLAREDISLWT